jgi:nucleotide-binding universal stress UspA family protein
LKNDHQQKDVVVKQGHTNFIQRIPTTLIMKTILVPTDYSAVAKNAAIFAFNLAPQLKAEKIIFYNSYQAPPVLTENVAPAMPIMDIETIRTISDEGMKHFVESVQAHCPPGLQVEPMAEYGMISSDIEEISKTTGADLIVMGITGTSKVEEVLIGSTATSVVRHTKVPVIIVPGDARLMQVKNVLLATNLKKVVETTPVQPIKNLLDATGAKLYVLNIEEKDNDKISEKTYQKELLNSLLSEYNPQFYFENNHDFIAGINEFVEANNIDLIITIPRKHGFFKGLFKESHSKKLAFHSRVPLMYVHLEDL